MNYPNLCCLIFPSNKLKGYSNYGKQMNNKNLNLLSAETLDIKVLHLQDGISVEFKVGRLRVKSNGDMISTNSERFCILFAINRKKLENACRGFVKNLKAVAVKELKIKRPPKAEISEKEKNL